jgi:nucleoside phosphorylase
MIQKVCNEKINMTEECKKIENAVINFYKKNSLYMERAYEFSKKINDINELNPAKIKKPGSDVPNTENLTTILIITANPIEKTVFLSYLHCYTELQNKDYRIESLSVYKHNYQITFLVFKWYNYLIYYCPLTEYGDETTRRAVITARNEFGKIDKILLLGICYGMGQKQSLGDILVSRCICGYRVNFRDNKNFYENIDVEIKYKSYLSSTISDELIRSIDSETCAKNFYCKMLRYTVDHENPPDYKVSIGTLASADHLISCYPVKLKIKRSLSNSKNNVGGKDIIGGEMEATGIIKAITPLPTSDKWKPDWIVIKAICDWGAIKNLSKRHKPSSARIKDSIQAYAMMNTMETFIHLLENDVWR